MRNWLTPRRSHESHASAAEPAGDAESRSSTRTWCPSAASSIAAAWPVRPPPTITISAMSALQWREGPEEPGDPLDPAVGRELGEVDALELDVLAVAHHPRPAQRRAVAVDTAREVDAATG